MDQIEGGSERFERLIFDFAENPTRYFSHRHEKFMEMKECSCSDCSRAHNNRRKLLEDSIIEHFTQHYPDKNTCIKILSLGCGELLQDFILLVRLINQGYRNFKVLLVDPEINPKAKCVNDLYKTISFIRGVNITLTCRHLLYKTPDGLEALLFSEADIARSAACEAMQDEYRAYPLEVQEGIAYAFDFDGINKLNPLTADPGLAIIANLTSAVRERTVGAFFFEGALCDWKITPRTFEVLHIAPNRRIEEFIPKETENLGIERGGSTIFSSRARDSIREHGLSEGRKKRGKADAVQNQVFSSLGYKFRIVCPYSKFEMLFLPLQGLQKKVGDLSNVEIWFEGEECGIEIKSLFESAFPGLKAEMHSEKDMRRRISETPINVIILGWRNIAEERIAHLPQEPPNTPRISCYEVLPSNDPEGYRLRKLTKNQMQLLSYL